MLTYADAETIVGFYYSRNAALLLVDFELSPYAVFDTICHAEQSYQRKSLPDGAFEKVYQRGNLTVVTGEPENKVIITLLLRTPKQWDRKIHTIREMPA